MRTIDESTPKTIETTDRLGDLYQDHLKYQQELREDRIQISQAMVEQIEADPDSRTDPYLTTLKGEQNYLLPDKTEEEFRVWFPEFSPQQQADMEQDWHNGLQWVISNNAQVKSTPGTLSAAEREELSNVLGAPPTPIVDATNPGHFVDQHDLHYEDGKPSDF